MEAENKKIYDLEERTFRFADRITDYVLKLPKTIPNIEYSHQLVRSGGSVGANYIEANEALGSKDFDLHIKISKKESKESRLWLRLLEVSENENINKERISLIQEINELMKIFGAIIEKSL